MKTFRKQILSAAVILLGIGSAYATHLDSKSEKKLAPKDGYIFNHSVGTCERVAACETIDNGMVCTVGNIPGQPQAFDLNTAGNLSTCNVELFQPPVN